MERCPEHDKLIETIHKIDKTTTELSVRINGSIHDIEHHIRAGQSWRLAIVGVVVSVIIQVIGFAYLWGQASKQISINTGRLDVIENSFRQPLPKM